MKAVKLNRRLLCTCLMLVICLLAINNHTLHGQQNLVPNPGFEQYKVCPEKANTTLVAGYEVVTNWFSVSEASPDYFNGCAKNTQVGVPRNFTGFMNARSGKGYIGLILRADPKIYHGSANYTEHIQTKLTAPLRKNRLYCFEIWICLGKNSTIAAKDFGVYFSKEQIAFPNPPDSLPEPHIAFPGDEYLTNTTQWIPLRGIYKAEGGERYLTIGNYEPWVEGRFERLRESFSPVDLKEFAYYIFDDVSLIEIRKPSQCECNMVTIKKPDQKDVKTEVEPEPREEKNEFEDVKVGESFILQNIFFDFDKSVLLPASFPELDKLVALMNKYPTMTIEIAGHTDYKGSVEYNIKLSYDRANSVVRYLIGKGIDPGRLTWVGHGKSKPIADNTTEEGRQINRRVEFKVLSK